MTVIEIVVISLAVVTPPTLLGLTIWATKTGRRTASLTIRDHAKIHNWYVALIGVLLGHWLSEFIPFALNYWPYCAAILIGVAIKDIIRAVMKWPYTWSNQPLGWLFIGVGLGALWWKQ